MKKLKLLKKVIKLTSLDKILLNFAIIVILISFILTLTEPNINSFFDGVWYSCVVISTVGFGDVVASSIIGKILTIILMFLGLIVISLFTGTIVNFYSEVNKVRKNEQVIKLFDELKDLENLSKEQLKNLSKKIKKYRH